MQVGKNEETTRELSDHLATVAKEVAHLDELSTSVEFSIVSTNELDTIRGSLVEIQIHVKAMAGRIGPGEDEEYDHIEVDEEPATAAAEGFRGALEHDIAIAGPIGPETAPDEQDWGRHAGPV
jgi:hypothetical protein